MSLFISINKPSQELEKCSIDTAITVLAANAAIEKKNGRLPKGPALDITFMLPHKSEIPPFTGMRMGGFTQENQTLFFESAVPEHIVNSKNASRYVVVALQDAVDNADEYFKGNNVHGFDKIHWYRAIMPLFATASAIANVA